jgi:thioredoxin reductase (NADPH)
MVLFMTDIVIIGGGPAGVSAALTAAQRGKSAQIITSRAEDSLLWKAEKIDNYPGLPAVTGASLIDILTDHAKSVGVEFIRDGHCPLCRWETFSCIRRFGLFGLRRGGAGDGLARAKAFPGEKEFLGAGSATAPPATECSTEEKRRGDRARGGCAGGGEFLGSIGCRVEYFDAKRAKKYEIHGSERVESLVADGAEYPVEGVFILRFGVAPDTLLPGLETESGHIRAAADMSTSVPGVFAAGDCVGAPYQVAKAAGEGNIAGISASKYVGTRRRWPNNAFRRC